MEKSVSDSQGLPCDSSRTFSPYANGTENIRFDSNGSVCFRATDPAGNVAYATHNVNGVDQPPSVSFPRVNGQTNPSRVTSLYPTFSWTFSDADAGDYQSAYQVVVTASGSAVPSWDSGKVPSQSVSAGYVGNNLSLDGTEYVWSVTVWDSQDVSSSSSGAFSMM